MEGSISTRTENAQNRRCEEGFELARGKAELKKKKENGDRRLKFKAMAGFCIMSNRIKLIEVIVNIF